MQIKQKCTSAYAIEEAYKALLTKLLSDDMAYAESLV